MSRPLRLVAALLILASGAMTACASGSDSTPIVPSDPLSTLPSAPASSTPSVPRTPSDSGVAAPAWATIPLTDVRTGETFTLAGAGDRVVFVEPMAVWCPSCRAQQETAREALTGLDASRVTWIALDVDPNETPEMLARYADENDFPFVYAMAGTDLSRELADALGAQVLSPPSSPVIVIGTDGTVTLTEFGHKSQARIQELAQQHGA